MLRPLPKIKQQLERLVNWSHTADSNGPMRQPADEPPLRAELYSVNQLEHHARGLAGSHDIARGTASDRLLPRLEENERILLRTYDLVTAAVEKDRRIVPAAEWLLDNFHVIEEQIRTARRHFPPSYSKGLPRLAKGPVAGYPRVYSIAMELITHVDGNLDAVSLQAFVSSYQTITPLTLGELWAIPIMLRLALIENLRRVAVRLAASLRDRGSATEWAGRMVEVVEQNPSDLVLVLADMARANPPLSSAFLAELTRHLHGQSPHFAFAQSWLEHRLSEQGLKIAHLVQMESQAQAVDQVSIGNTITSLRFLGLTNWREFVEGGSFVEQTLRGDPAGVYAHMDFATRDIYRHAVEEVAKHSLLTQDEVAQKAIRLAETASVARQGGRMAHVGYYLVDKGRPALEAAAGMKSSPWTVLRRGVRRHPLFFYLFGVAALTACIMAGLYAWVEQGGLPPWILALVSLPALMCAVHLAIGVVNWLVTVFIGPLPLPRMDFREGIPPEHRTMVVVPTMLTSARAVRNLLETIEIHYVANCDEHLHFALLTDLKDAPQEVMPGDADLIREAREGIESLNEKYKSDRTDAFFLFHRPRRWNVQDCVWMGYERKRGKLKEFNALLRGGSRDSFQEIVGDAGVLPDIRYVITLDTDTELPRDAARGLVESMAHPLNRPVFDTKRNRVVDGYSIIQPRVGTSLPSASRSWYVRLFAADSGLDPYTRAVSDIYQDLFGEGSFIGKGIYDVDTFHRACACLPDNAILSHDLLESAYARSALLTNVEVYEDHPYQHSADVSRRRRWIRGDWQIAWWLLPRVPGQDARWNPNPISILSKWKIFDNLRRSLVPLAMLMLLCLAWLLPWLWFSTGTTLLAIAVMAAIPVMSGAVELVRKPVDLPFWMHARAVAPGIVRQAGQVLFTLVFIAHDACVSIDSIARTLTRLLWTHRKMLEWTTSSDAGLRARTDLWGHFRSMWIGPAGAVIVLALIALIRPDHLPVSGPILGLWVFSPFIAWWMSRPIVAQEPRLSEGQVVFLRNLARRTWRYFETYVTADDNWLPPDNVQEYPTAQTASRTSPTNIGVALLANLSAYDFGYCSANQLLQRTQHTFETMGRLERYHGHFFNWYDTRSLTALPPRYVSTVDSGNLAGHLLVLRRGLLELIDAKILPARAFGGVLDTLRVLMDAVRDSVGTPEPGGDPLPARERLRKAERLEAELGDPPNTLGTSILFLRRVADWAVDAGTVDSPDGESQAWARALEQCAADHHDDVAHLAPWALLSPPPKSLRQEGPPEAARRIGALGELLRRLEEIPTLRQVAGLKQSLLPSIDAIRADLCGGDPDSKTPPQDEEFNNWLADLRRAVIEASQNALDRIQALEAVAEHCHEFSDMDFSFLYDKSRNLLSIGCNVGDHRMDSGYYDLLASEARLASFYAISQGQLGQEHWFALGRMLTTSRGAPALLSWNGSMFEYLMPLLVMPTYENTLLHQTCKAVVRRQIKYGRQRGVPWGISESGFNAWGVHLDYQYRAFGVPGLGLKRGLAEDLVVAPYATAMALMVDPEAACRNLERLTAEGRQGRFGFYEAIDYTPSRLPLGVRSATVRSFMTHHQGMSLLSLAYLMLDRPMQRRFQADPTLQATCLLLQERIPKTTVPIFPHAVEAGTTRTASSDAEGTMRILTDPGSPVPAVHLLSNGRYHVMVSSAGGGYSRWRELAVTRWREDPTRDCWGTFCYVRDVDSGRFWSIAHQPTLRPSKSYEAIFVQGKAEFRRRDDEIETHTEISVSPEDDIELRRITITNRSDRPRTIEVTSYAEVVLAPAAQDQSHPAFSNLFVQTELVRSQQAILCTRRPRSAEERPPWMVHLMTVQGEASGDISFETDRAKFLGRGRTLVSPAAMIGSGRLSDSEGSVLDPVVSIRQAVRIQPNETARIDLITGVAGTHEAATALVDKYDDPRLADRVFELAWTHSNAELHHLNAVEAEAQLYGRLAGSVIYATSRYRSAPGILAQNRRGQSGLWGYGISGDLPIVLVRIRDREKLDLVYQAVQAHAYWRMKGLNADLVIWNEDDSVYRQELHDTIMNLIAASAEAAMVDKPGGVFLRRAEQIAEEDRVLLQAVARVALADDAGTLAEQVERRGRPRTPMAILRTVRHRAQPAAAATPKYDLAFFNGLGGFTHDGREYITILNPGENTPAPWVNVIANPQFGTVVSESGAVYTWAENSHDFRITPWSNDPVSGGGEALYIRDEESGSVWSPSPQPARGAMAYVVRHGFGYSIFEYQEDGIASELTFYVAMDAPVKFVRLKIMNRSGRPRSLSVTAFWELVLGESRDKTLMHVVTELDPVTGAIFARNAYNPDSGGRVVFADSSETARTMTADRTEFLGRNGTPANPAAMGRVRLSGRVGAGLDPCAAIQAPVTIEAGQEKEIVFILGSADSEDQARRIVQQNRGVSAAQRALEGVWEYWSRTLGVLYVETPDPAVNFLSNGWLMYQTLSCRMWARTGFYQSGGAYGFRDQLQDAMALLHAEPLLLRAHLLCAAARQFNDGDVQHWWHPPSGRGVRTHCSDDYLWLPHAVCRYVTATGDTGVLEERVPFLNGRPLRPEEDSYYDLPQVSGEVDTLYEHCVRAINNGLRVGAHGLPLMGTGDWNDGMNLVGEQGKGESVWLGFFLYDVLTGFAEQARRHGDNVFADKCLDEAGRLRLRMEETAWDGQWYRRAFFDNGEPLGSAENAECQIDSIPQSWSVLSRAGDPVRAKAAMDSVDRRLVHRDTQLIQLFDPPFDKSELNPGYVKGYIPGVRENGGQYTHAAIWAAMAFAAMGDSKRAWELFSLLSPIAHGASPETIRVYKVEPYVMAADIYGAAPHTGRGGWTWYTGAAGWMYRLITESLLGLQLRTDLLQFTPCLPPHWKTFKIHYRYRETFYHITVCNGGGGKSVNRLVLDGELQTDKTVRLVDDRNTHNIELGID